MVQQQDIVVVSGLSKKYVLLPLQSICCVSLMPKKAFVKIKMLCIIIVFVLFCSLVNYISVLTVEETPLFNVVVFLLRQVARLSDHLYPKHVFNSISKINLFNFDCKLSIRWTTTNCITTSRMYSLELYSTICYKSPTYLLHVAKSCLICRQSYQNDLGS